MCGLEPLLPTIFAENAGCFESPLETAVQLFERLTLTGLNEHVDSFAGASEAEMRVDAAQVDIGQRCFNYQGQRTGLPIVKQAPEPRFSRPGDLRQMLDPIVHRLSALRLEVQGTVRADDVRIHSIGEETARPTRKT